MTLGQSSSRAQLGTSAVPLRDGQRRNAARKNKVSLSLRVVVLAACFLATASAEAQKDRVFVVPLDDLKLWASKITVPLNLQITGHSKVHSVKSDCEMHFGAKAPGYRGDPDGWVLEPMNLCLEPFPGKAGHSNRDWEEFGTSLVNAKVRVEGVPRIWPEHLVGGSPSNPDHALEIHPMTKLQRGNQVREFSTFIYAPEGFDGGLTEETAAKILRELEVTVTEKNGTVEVTFNAGRIGNFSTLEIALSREGLTEIDGSYRLRGEVILGRSERRPVSLVTVAGSEINQAIQKFAKSTRRKRATITALALFSLNPDALYRAAVDSHGSEVSVVDPVQLILYGEPDEHQ